MAGYKYLRAKTELQVALIFYIVSPWSPVNNGYLMFICCLVITISSLLYLCWMSLGVLEHLKSIYAMCFISYTWVVMKND